MKTKLLLIALPLALMACKGKTTTDTPLGDSSAVAIPPAVADTSAQVKEEPIIKTLESKLEGNDILRAIADAYKGQIVVLDIWATWCGPCTRAIEETSTIKQELRKKGVAFVYLADETSPEADWQQRIQLIHGTHYRISNLQMASLGVVGYPSYLVLDKSGKVAYDNRATAGFPGNDALVEIVKKLNK